MFPRLEYLEWMAGRADAAPYDLGTSDLGDDDPDRDVLEPPRLADRPSPPAGASLANLLAEEYDVQPESILVTAGATHANFIAYAAAMELAESETVLVENPGYEPLVKTPEGLDATVSRFDRGEDGALDPGRIEATVTEDTAIVATSNRHNPTGALAERSTIADAAAAARTVDATLLVDEVYAPYVIEERDGAFGGPSAASIDNVVVTGSLTKFFGLGELRIGWLVGDPAFVRRARRIAYHLPDVAGPSRSLAGRALYAAESLAEAQRARVETNYELLSTFVSERDDLAGDVHDGATFAFLKPTQPVDTLVEAAWEEGVLVVPGRFYDVPDRIRVSAGGPPTDVEVSLGRFAQVLTDVGQTSNS
jgi:aspartate/methionine/tyrosine aminotransferase